jgi:hypothetical protein
LIITDGQTRGFEMTKTTGNTGLNSAPVDVLAVMDFEREVAIECGTLIAGSTRYTSVQAARAAVAELIEAAGEFHEANEKIGDRKFGNAHERLKRYGTAERRLRAAIARCGGVK